MARVVKSKRTIGPGEQRDDCPFCGESLKLQVKEHALKEPKVFYQWSCKCGWFSKLFKDAFEAFQFFNRRDGILPAEMEKKPIIKITKTPEDAEPETDFTGNNDEDNPMAGIDVQALRDLRDKVAVRQKAYTGEEF